MRSDNSTTLWSIWLGVLAQDKKAPEELVAESEHYCISTAINRSTPPDLIVAGVDTACNLLQQEG